MPPDEATSTQMSPAEFNAGAPVSEPATSSVQTTTPAPANTASADQPSIESMSLRDFASGLGYQFGADVADDYAALSHLVSQASLAQRLSQEQQQQDIYAQLGRQLAPRANEFQQLLRGQQQQKPAPKPYEPPEFDERWAALVDRDPATGLYVAKRGVPPEIADKANAYQEWGQAFMRNPAKVLQPLIEETRQQAVAEVRMEVQQMIEQERVRSQVSQLVQTAAPWYYAADANGNYIPDPINGGYQASPLGRQYLQALNALGQAGMKNPVDRDRFARQILAPQIAAATSGQQQPVDQRAATGNARQQHALAGNRAGNRNALQSLSPLERQQTPGATEPERKGRSMAAQMLEMLEAEGVTNKDYFQGID